MDGQQGMQERSSVCTNVQAGMAFLAENPEAFGFVPDACPVVTNELLLAVSGHGATAGAISPTYPVEFGGVDGLFDTVYSGLIARTDENALLLRGTFGEVEGRQEHTIGRYAAALAEAVALHVLQGSAKGASLEQTCVLLGQEIPRALDALRHIMGTDGGEITQDPAFFSVSFGACRILPEEEGHYTLEIIAAGDFRVFLLDAKGMSPLWLENTAAFSSADPRAPVGTSIHIHHPDPFAILLLSDSVCAIDAAEYRSLREFPGLAWRYRMRLEEYFLRIITACVREQEFGERAEHFFTGRSHGRDSASGAMMILHGQSTYEAFRGACQARLGRLEDMISLLPNGYDPAHVEKQLSREDTEMAYLERLLAQENGLTDRVAEALRLCALEKLHQESAVEPPPSDVPAYRRLTHAEIHRLYREYDVENDEDRARIAEYQRTLLRQFSDHWITLRPLLKDALASTGEVYAPTTAYRVACDGEFNEALQHNARLGVMLHARKQRMDRVERLLNEGLNWFQRGKNDWLSAQAEDEEPIAWAQELAVSLPPALDELIAEIRAHSEDYRVLLAAYRDERDALFARDTALPHGLFAYSWQAILNGTLSDERWDAMSMALSEAADVSRPDLVPYLDWLDSLRQISQATATLLTRIEKRAADRRMARDVANRADLHLACLRASAYEDTDWGEAVLDLMDTAHRNDYRAMVRGWQEMRELMNKQAAAYTAYRSMYERYV